MFDYSHRLLDGSVVVVRNSEIGRLLSNHWTLLTALVIALLIIAAKPYGFQNITPIWMSVPLVFFMVVTTVINFLLVAGLFNRVLVPRFRGPAPSFVVSSIAALLELIMMEFLMNVLVQDPISGTVEFATKWAFSTIVLEGTIFVFGSFLYPIVAQEASLLSSKGVNEKKIGNSEVSKKPISVDIGGKTFNILKVQRIEAVNVYVKVVTDDNEYLVREKFSDAIAVFPNSTGIQTHRSHWVSLKYVSGSVLVDGKPVLSLITGETVPISRSRFMQIEAVLTQLRDNAIE